MKNLTANLSNRMITKLSLAVFTIILLTGVIYSLITLFFTNKYFEEASQRLHANLANHLIDEKFGSGESPFLEDGSVNKALFGDLMHDMMAVNRGIEVYLLDDLGVILYSVVLNHDEPNAPIKKVNLSPIKQFITNQKYILGDDPRDSNQQKIFSAAPYRHDGRTGYVYIVLAGKAFEEVTDSLLSSYFIKTGIGFSLATIIFSAVLGAGAVFWITRSLRNVIYQVQRFKEGDLEARIENAKNSDLSILAVSFNEMAETIVSNIEKIQSVDHLRRELIANVSHDLRTPLAIMQGYIETLQIKNAELSKEEQAHHLKTIHKSSEKLSRLVAQLFEYSKLEAKQVVPEKEPFSMVELAYDIHSKYLVLANENNIQIKLDAEEGLPLVFADISLVERAIQNLMDNALKFTPTDGEVIIQIRKNNKSVSIRIVDSGPGVPEDQIEYIFERFRQADTQPRAVKKAGAGLGLAIVKKIIEIHDSTIEVVNRPNGGAAFQFSLPVHTLS